ncbi:MAG: hypothetical protein WAK31_30300 [Chthoniobacterales bacterium]
MHHFTQQQMADFLRTIAVTRDTEMDCSAYACFEAQLAKHRQAGLPSDDALEQAEHHLLVCPGCRERAQALRRILESSG